MIFVGTLNVEIFKPDNAVKYAGLKCPEIEEVLRVAIHVERPKRRCCAVLVTVAERALAIGGGAGGINEPRTLAQAPLAKCAGITVIVFEKIVGVLFRRGTARAEVNTGCRLRRRVGFHAFNKLRGRNRIIETQADKIGPFPISPKLIHEEKVLVSSAVEFRDNVASDEAGGTGNYNRSAHDLVVFP